MFIEAGDLSVGLTGLFFLHIRYRVQGTGYFLYWTAQISFSWGVQLTETKELRTVMRGIWQYGSIYYSFLSIYLLGPASALAGLVLCLGPGPCPEGTLAAMAARLPDKSYFGRQFTPGKHEKKEDRQTHRHNKIKRTHKHM